MKYKYTGKHEVHIAKVGFVPVGATIDVPFEIDHPKFEEVKEDKKKKEDKE